MQNFTKIDIVALINNPDTTVVDAVNSEIIEKIKTRFSTEEQKLFASSFYCYLNHDSRKEFIVDLENVWKWLGFSRIDPAKRLLEKRFTINTDYKVFQRKVENVEERNLGGRPKDIVLLTINTFKKFCLMAGTSKASEIHDYYINLEEIMHDIVKEQYKNVLESNKKLLEEKDKDKKLEKHKVLLDILDKKNCIYVIEISEGLVKIGSSYDIKSRRQSIANTFGGQGIFLDVFECEHFREAERNILMDPNVRQNLVRDRLETGHSSSEVIKLSNEFTYINLLEIIKRYVIQDKFLTPSQVLEKQKIQLIQCLVDKGNTIEDIIKLIQTPFVVQTSINSVNNSENIKKETNIEVLKIKDNKGKQIQQIDPNDLTRIVKVYKNMETLLDNRRSEFSETGIRDAISESKIYKKYRWMFVEPGQNPNIVYNIKPTVEKKIFRHIIIVELDESKSTILRHFQSLDIAATEIKIPKHLMKKIVKEQQVYNNCYYIDKRDCPEELIDKYHQPLEFVPKGSIKLRAFNPKTGEEKLFPSMRHAYDFCKIHHKTVRRVVENKTLYNGMLWEIL